MKKLFFFFMFCMLSTVIWATDNWYSGVWTAKYYSYYEKGNVGPADNWYATDFDDSGWGTLTMPIANRAGYFSPYTLWSRPNTDNIYVRGVLTVSSSNNWSYILKATNDDDAQIYVNGQSVYTAGCKSSTNYSNIDITQYMNAGNNYIAGHCCDTGGEGFLDIHIICKINIGNLTYAYMGDGKVCLVGNSLTNPMTIEIPETVSDGSETYTVVSIGTNAFSNLSTLQSVTLPASVTEIKGGAFSGCTELTSINLDNISTIGAKAFYDCNKLGDLNVPALTDMDETAFGSSQSSSVVSGDYGFSICRALINGKITLGATITSYSGNDFALTIPESLEYEGTEYPVTAIGSSVFSGNTNLTSVTLPSSLKSINASAFSGCTNLISVTIPDALTTIGESAFNGCTSLATVLISGNSHLKTIGSSAFYNCSLLPTFTMPTGVTTIGSQAFYNCSKLASIKIPDGLKTINSSTFYGCSSLKTVEISDEASLETIGENAFRGCYALTSFNFPASLQSIGSYAFACNRRSSDTYNNINYYYYDNSYYVNLSVIDLSKCAKLTTIGEMAFYGTKAKEIDLSNCVSLTSIGTRSFHTNNNVKEINLSGCSSLSTIGDYAFCNTGNDATLILSGCSSLTTINQYAFAKCGIKSVDLTGCTSLVSIGSYAFASCTNLTSMNIPASVTGLGTYAFSGDTRLKSVTFGSSSALKSVGNYAFQNCSNLQSIDMPAGVGSINSYTFDGCTTLKTVQLAASGDLKSIGMSAFNGCTSMTTLAIPTTVTSIASDAFNFGTANTVLVFASADPAGYDANMFSALGDGNNVRIKIPASSLSTYQAKYPDITFITTDVERIELNYSTLQASVNNDYQFSATVYPEEAINAIQWISSDESIATIDAEGKLHGVAPGDVTITALALDGSNISQVGQVNVRFVDMESIQFAKASYWMKSGNTGNVSITTTPANASDREVTFTTSNPEVATVDENGNVTAVSVGKCTVTATSASNAGATATAEIDVRAYKPARWIIEDANGDGYFTLKNLEADEYAIVTDSWNNYENVKFGTSGEGNSQSEWIIYSCATEEPVNKIEEGVSYYLQNRWVKESYSGTRGWSCVNDNKFTVGWYSSNKSIVEFAKNDDAYYLAIDGNLTQEVNSSNTSTIGLYAESESDEDWDYTLCNSIYYPETLSAKMTLYKGSSKDVVMPEKVKQDEVEYPVFGMTGTRDVASAVFTNTRDIVTLTLPSTFRYFGPDAIRECTVLRSVNIPEGVTTIPYQTFLYCYYLDDVVMSSTVKSIDKDAFWHCTGLTNVTLNENLENVANTAFDGCSMLSAYIIPSTNANYVTPEDGVLYNKDMSDIVLFPKGKSGSYTIPSTMTIVRSGLFSGAGKLTNVIIPNTIVSIGSSAFTNCSSLNEISIPASVTDIQENAFNVSSLEKILLEETPATWSSNNAFCSTAFLFVPNDKVSTYKGAWVDLASRIYPKDNLAKEVTVQATDGASNLLIAIGGVGNESSIIGMKLHGTINGYDIMLMRNKMTNLRYLDMSDVTIVPEKDNYEYYTGYHTEQNVLGAYSFYDVDNLRSVTLPKNITSIGSRALSECDNLLSVKGMPETCKTVSDHTFSNSSKLNDITIGEGVHTIGSYAFYDCNGLKTISIPSSVTSIQDHAFYDSNNLETVNFSEGLTSIGRYAFCYCYNLKDLKLPSSLTTISSYAFQSCTSLKDIHIPSMVESIGDYAFVNCGTQNVYAYTLNPISINQNTFDYDGVTLNAPQYPESVFNAYYYDTQWSQFTNVKAFNAQYSMWYAGENEDITVKDEETIPNEDGEQATGEMRPGSSLTYEGSAYQWLDKLNLKWKGGKFPSFIDNGKENIDELTFLLEVKANQWYFFCFPFDIDLTKCKFNGKYKWRYYDADERALKGSGGWKSVEGTTLKAWKGYIFNAQKAGEIELNILDPEFTAVDKKVTLTTAASENAQDASWNFIGNPNLSYYDIGDLATSYNSPITVWNASNNTYDAVMPGDDDYQFHPFEAFFVQKPADTDNVTFEQENRRSCNDAEKQSKVRRRILAERGVDKDRMIINMAITDGDKTDRTRVVFNDEKSLEYEAECDASKFMSESATVQLYTLDSKNVKYAINERPSAEKTVLLGYTAAKAGTFSISALRMDCPMVLKDTKTGTIHNLSENDYEFQTEAGTFDNRFILMSAEATGVAVVNAGTFVVQATSDGLMLTGLNGQKAVIYNAAGAVAAEVSEDGDVNLPAGVYVISVGDSSRKVLVK